jgi:hypothetical protein
VPGSPCGTAKFIIWYNDLILCSLRVSHFLFAFIQVNIEPPFKKTAFFFGLASLVPLDDCHQNCWLCISELNSSNILCRLERQISPFAHPPLKEDHGCCSPLWGTYITCKSLPLPLGLLRSHWVDEPALPWVWSAENSQAKLLLFFFREDNRCQSCFPI